LEEIPLEWVVAALAFTLVASAFFSISETAMMAINRYRLRHLVSQGHGGARRAAELLKRTDRLLGGILIGNTLTIAASTTIAGVIAVHFLGEDRLTYAISTLVISFVIIIFCEITPKVIGATYPERCALLLAYALRPTMRLLQPASWFVNIFVRPLLWILRVRPEEHAEAPKLSPEEIRTLVLESSSFMPKKHLSDLGELTVQDVMLPRTRIEAITLEATPEELVHQISTAYHMRLPVYANHEGELLGVLHLRKALGLLAAGTLNRQAIEELVAEAYFVPASTPALAQLQFFQERKEHIALVVDEYGELMGLVTLEDIIEEIIGKFTTSLPSPTPALSWDEDGAATTDGATAVREVNRALGLDLPTGGPKTINGLILEHLQDIPEANVSLKIAGVPVEIVSAQGRAVKTVRLFRPPEPPRESPG
jgi:Mg2+/Co2+ transporter CorB